MLALSSFLFHFKISKFEFPEAEVHNYHNKLQTSCGRDIIRLDFNYV